MGVCVFCISVMGAFAQDAAGGGRPRPYLELRGGPTLQAGADFVKGSSYWQLEKEGGDKGKYVDKPIDAISPNLAFAIPIEGKFHIAMAPPSGKFGGLEMTFPFTFTYALPYTGGTGLNINSLSGSVGVWFEIIVNF